MAAQDNLSQELFFKAHRGIAAESVSQKRNVGMHWSADPVIAKDFAVDNNEPGLSKPYVLHAEVPMSSVETDTNELLDKDVGGAFSGEKEVPVGIGNKIRITGRTTLRKDPNINDGTNRHRYSRARTRTYNPPRDATA
jgi:hypothetical protein